MKNLVFIILALFPLLLKAQDIVRFSNGKELLCKVEGITDTTVWVVQSKGKKVKEKILPADEIFSVVLGDSSEVVIYIPDAEDSLSFTVEQMRSYVNGASYARRHYKASIATSGAFLAGAGGGLIGFWGLSIPLAYDLIIGWLSPYPKNYRKEKRPDNMDDFFIIGFQDVAQKKKAHRVIISSISGVAAIAVYTTLMTK